MQDPAGGGDKTLGLIVVKRLSVFLLSVDLVVVFFWTTGNFVPFLDGTQLMLLAVLRLVSLGLAVTAIAGLASSLLLGRGRPRPSRLAGAGGYLILALLGLSCLVLSSALAILSGGLSPSP